MKSRKADKVVRRQLADGTVREYRYARGVPRRKRAADTLGALIEAYQRSPEWLGLKASTRTNYTIYLRPLDRVKHVAVHAITRRDLLDVRDIIAAKRGPGAATGFVRAVSSLFGWAVDREWRETSPAHRLPALPGGHLAAWAAAQAAAAEAGLPEHLRRAVVLARYTGQRRGDLCAMTWAAFDGERIRVRQQKTGAELVIACHPTLRAELLAWRAAAPLGSVTILTDAKGRPWKPTRLSHDLPEALVKLGLPRSLNVHGLRKLAAASLADAGCTPHEIAAVTGHRTLAMVEFYTRSADQERLASAAVVKLADWRAS